MRSTNFVTCCCEMEVKKVNTFSGHRDCVYVLERLVENHRFISAAGDGMVVRWDFNAPDEGELIAKVDNSVYALAHVPGKDLLIIGNNFKGLHVIDLVHKKEIRNLHFTDAAIFDILVSNGHVYVATGEGKVVDFCLHDFSVHKVHQYATESARCLAIHNNGDLAVGYSDNTLRIIHSDGRLSELSGHTNSIFSLAFSPDGSELLSGGRDAHLKVWSVAQEYALKTSIVAHMYAINDIVFSPDGRHYATASMDKSIKIWDANSHRLLKVVDKSRHAGHATSVNKLLWTSFEDVLVSASDDRKISLWRFSGN